MTVRSLPRSLEAAMARSAARSRETASMPCAGLLATPKLIVTGMDASAKVRCVARRRRSATMKAPRSSVSGSSRANSSPPDAGGLVDAALPLEAAAGHELQGAVAAGMAMALVHSGEGIEVAHDHRQRPVGTRRTLELRVEQLLQGAPVEQSGERVCARRVGDSRAQGHNSPVLVHGKACQPKRAGIREKRSEEAYRLHFPTFIDLRMKSLKD